MKMTGDKSACIAALNGQGKKLGGKWGGGEGGGIKPDMTHA